MKERASEYSGDRLGLRPAIALLCWPVITRVGNVKNNDPALVEAIAAD